MPRNSDKRERLVEAAKHLIHQQGFGQTTLADIAEESGVPLGNVYYYFKTKDDIASAVIDERMQEFRALAAEWEKQPDPKRRLLAFLDMPSAMRDTVASHGCPVGSLAQELNKEHSPLAQQADHLLKAHLDWVRKQFRELDRTDADDLGLQMIATLQGVSLLCNTLRNPMIVDRQIKRLRAWLEAL